MFFQRVMSKGLHTFLGLLLPLALIGLIGLNGRLVADGYCFCVALVMEDNDPLAFVSTLYETWHGEVYSQFVQVLFAWWPVVNLGQGWAVTISLWIFFLAVFFVTRELMRAVSSGISPLSLYFATSLLSFTIVVSIIAPAALPIQDEYEFLTQQSFVAQVFMRYPGLVALAAGNLLLVGVALAVLRRYGHSGLAYATFLTPIAFLAGLSNYSFTGFYGFLIIGLGLLPIAAISVAKVKVFLNRTIIPLAGLIIGFSISFLSPGANVRKNEIFDRTDDRTSLDWLRNGSGDAVWAFATPFTLSALAVFLVALAIGYALLTKNPDSQFKPLFKPAVWLTGSFALALVTAVPSLLSYSAAWHTVFPRSALLITLAFCGLRAGSLLHVKTKAFGRAILNPIFKVGALAIVLGLIAMSISWTSLLPERWSAGDLPIHPVKSGWGNSIYFSDTEDPGWRQCYLELEPHLRDRKMELSP